MEGVVFDFGNVLYSVDYARMARRLAGERAEELLASFVGSPLQIAYETGRADLATVLRELERAGFPAREDEFLEAYLGIFDPVPGAADLLRTLAEARPLGLLSNTSSEHARLFIEGVPEFKLLRARVYSFELGCMKPDPRLYREAARRLGLPARELAYVDDIEAYARGALQVGMTGLCFAGVERLRGDLVELGFRELERA
ncbi:MAG: HAD-IA family hydrolase [Deltaproteobacteria bacterium]|nr:HAD-IA family hydrolase [Deltaproteobacteria bacterium]